jgi:hypothetical protein
MMAGIGMANVTTGFTTNPIVIGFNATLATYIPQAYGAKQLRQCGVYLTKARIIIFCA